MARISKYVEITPEGKYVGHIYDRELIKECIEKGKHYVGATTIPKSRDENWRKRNNESYGGKRITEARRTYSDIDKDWVTTELERIEADSKEELSRLLDKREDYWMDVKDSVNNGFNDYKNSERHFSKEHCANISKNHRDYQTEETRKKLSEANKGRVVSEETKQKISEGNTGKVRTPEQRSAQSERMKGQVPVAATAAAKEWVKKNGAYWKTHPISDETKAKMKAVHQERGTAVIATFPDGTEHDYTTMLDAAKAATAHVAHMGHKVGVGSVSHCIKTGGKTKDNFKFRKK